MYDLDKFEATQEVLRLILESMSLLNEMHIIRQDSEKHQELIREKLDEATELLNKDNDPN